MTVDVDLASEGPALRVSRAQVEEGLGERGKDRSVWQSCSYTEIGPSSTPRQSLH